MTLMGQRIWDDIKLKASQMGHLISNFDPGGTTPACYLPPKMDFSFTFIFVVHDSAMTVKPRRAFLEPHM